MLESLYITYSYFCFFNATATTEIYTYGHTRSLHDALPISTMSASDRKILTDMSAPAPANSASPRIPSATNPSTAFAPSNAPLPTSMKNWITPARSDERRVGKAGGSPFRPRWSQYHKNKQIENTERRSTSTRTKLDKQ